MFNTTAAATSVVPPPPAHANDQANQQCCLICGDERHKMTSCTQFTGCEVAVYCSWNRQVLILRRPDFSSVTFGDIHEMLQLAPVPTTSTNTNTTTTSTEDLVSLYYNGVLLPRSPKALLASAHVRPAACIFAVIHDLVPNTTSAATSLQRQGDDHQPQNLCPRLPESQMRLFDEIMNYVRTLEDQEAATLAMIPDSNNGDVSTSNHTTSSSSEPDASYGVMLPASDFNLMAKYRGCKWTDLKDSVPRMGSMSTSMQMDDLGLEDLIAESMHGSDSTSRSMASTSRYSAGSSGTNASSPSVVSVNSEGTIRTKSDGSGRDRHYFFGLDSNIGVAVSKNSSLSTATASASTSAFNRSPAVPQNTPAGSFQHVVPSNTPVGSMQSLHQIAAPTNTPAGSLQAVVPTNTPASSVHLFKPGDEAEPCLMAADLAARRAALQEEDARAESLLESIVRSATSEVDAQPQVSKPSELLAQTQRRREVDTTAKPRHVEKQGKQEGKKKKSAPKKDEWKVVGQDKTKKGSKVKQERSSSAATTPSKSASKDERAKAKKELKKDTTKPQKEEQDSPAKVEEEKHPKKGAIQNLVDTIVQESSSSSKSNRRVSELLPRHLSATVSIRTSFHVPVRAALEIAAAFGDIIRLRLIVRPPFRQIFLEYRSEESAAKAIQCPSVKDFAIEPGRAVIHGNRKYDALLVDGVFEPMDLEKFLAENCVAETDVFSIETCQQQRYAPRLLAFLDDLAASGTPELANINRAVELQETQLPVLPSSGTGSDETNVIPAQDLSSVPKPPSDRSTVAASASTTGGQQPLQQPAARRTAEVRSSTGNNDTRGEPSVRRQVHRPYDMSCGAADHGQLAHPPPHSYSSHRYHTYDDETYALNYGYDTHQSGYPAPPDESYPHPYRHQHHHRQQQYQPQRQSHYYQQQQLPEYFESHTVVRPPPTIMRAPAVSNLTPTGVPESPVVQTTPVNQWMQQRCEDLNTSTMTAGSTGTAGGGNNNAAGSMVTPVQQKILQISSNNGICLSDAMLENRPQLRDPPTATTSFANRATSYSHSPPYGSGSRYSPSSGGTSSKLYTPPQMRPEDVHRGPTIGKVDKVMSAAAAQKLQQLRQDVRQSPSSGYSERYEELFKLALSAGHHYVRSGTTTSFNEAMNAAMEAVDVAQENPLRLLRSYAVIVALYAHHGFIGDAMKFALDAIAVQCDALDQNDALNVLVVIGLLVEKVDPEIASIIYTKVHRRSESLGIRCDVFSSGAPETLSEAVIPGVSNLPAAFLSGIVNVSIF